MQHMRGPQIQQESSNPINSLRTSIFEMECCNQELCVDCFEKSLAQDSKCPFCKKELRPENPTVRSSAWDESDNENAARIWQERDDSEDENVAAVEQMIAREAAQAQARRNFEITHSLPSHWVRTRIFVPGATPKRLARASRQRSRSYRRSGRYRGGSRGE